MKAVIDTNVVISGVFFGGYPRLVLEAVLLNKFIACANKSIIDEYNEIVSEMIDRKQGCLDKSILSPLIDSISIFDEKTKVKVCRDPYDDKFIECAVDSGASFIISGDKDLLDLREYKGIKIVTAAYFLNGMLEGK